MTSSGLSQTGNGSRSSLVLSAATDRQEWEGSISQGAWRILPGMVLRLSELDPAEAKHLGAIKCPTFAGRPFVPPKPLTSRRIAIVSTAGLQLRGERGFAH